MRRETIIRRLTVLAVVVVPPLAGATTVINFDDFSHAGSLPISGDRYLASGVRLSTNGVRLQVAGGFSDGSSDFTNTPPYWLHVRDGVGDIIIEFVLPGTAIPGATDYASFYMADYNTGNGAPWVVSAYDLAGSLLDQRTGTTNDEVLIDFSSSTKRIHKIIVASPEDDGIDTLTFGDIVPEPQAIMLLAMSLIAVPFRRRIYPR